MKNTQALKLMLLAFIVVGLSGAATVQARPASNSQVPAVIDVGVLIPYTGGLDTVAEGIADGVRNAAYKVNQSSDFGFDINLIIEDTELDTVKATTAYAKFKGAGVKLIIGAAASSVSTKIAELAKVDQIVQISYASTAASLSNASLDYFFRVVPTDALQAQGNAALLDDLGYKSIVIVNRQDDYGNGFASGLKTDFEALGGKVLATIGYPADSTDFGATVTEIKKHDPDAISLITFVQDGASLMTELRANGVNVPFVGVDGNADASLANATKTTATIVSDSDLMLATRPHSPIAGEGGYDTFLTDRTACKNAGVCVDTATDPVIFEDFAYDAMMVGALAVKAAGDYDGALIKAQVKTAGAAYDGATGNKKFSTTTGDITAASYDVVQFQNGELVTVASWDSANGLQKNSKFKDQAVTASTPGFEAFYIFGIFAVIGVISLRARKQKK